MKHTLLPEMLHEQWLGGRLHYWPAFLNAEVAGKLYRQLRHDLPWRQDSIRLYGRRLSLPRLQCWFGPRAYRYSGLVLPACPLPAPLQGLIKEVSHQCGHDFNAVLVNYYRCGRDHVSWHSDDEPELGASPVIASLSLGAERLFQLRPRQGGKALGVRLAHGSLLLMQGDLQQGFQHRLPPDPRCEKGRINLSFRKLST